MADKKVTQLTDLGTALDTADLFHVIDDPAGTPINKKISAANVFNNIPSWIALKQTAQTITASGSAQAANLTTAITLVDATSNTAPTSLAAASTDGQIKTILPIREKRICIETCRKRWSQFVANFSVGVTVNDAASISMFTGMCCD